MRQLAIGFGITLAAVGIWIGVSAMRPPLTTREVRISGGRSALSFVASAMKQNQLAIHLNYALTADECSTCTLPAFKMQNANLVVEIKDGKFSKFEGGKITHKGSFKLTGAGKAIDAKNLSITASNTTKSGLCLTADTGNGPFVAFDLATPRGMYQAKADELVLEDMDVLISQGLAEELGRPELSGSPIGKLSVFGESEAIDGGGDIEGVPTESTAYAGLDISLSAMGQLGVATNPTGRVGTYPNGRNGLTMSTTSCNVGTVNIPWSAPMQTAHPVIALNLYRQRNGRFEQVGWSWLKHGFLATNSNGCGTCQNPGTNSLLGLNCSDTYGPGNNGDRFYLGARDEVNPLTGVWTCQGSWFSNYVNDCTRRNPGAVTLDAVDHRLDVLDSDMGNAGAQYFYEAYYITPNDINTYNNIGSREASMSWSGTAWSISTTGTQVQGPAINRWGDERFTAQPQNEGDVIVAVQTTDLGGGMWHYEYAVYNHTLDRQVRQFSVPLPVGAVVQNIGFRDIDRNPVNDWPGTQNPRSISWTTEAFGNPGANPLKYSSVFNFRFDTDVPPASSMSTLTLHKAGTLPSLTAATKGPLVLDAPASYTLVNGGVFGGNLQSLADSDNNRLEIGPVDSGSRSGTGLIGSFQAPAGAITKLLVGVEASNTLTTGGGAQQAIEMYNWTTSAWELLDTRAATLADSEATITLTSNVSRFVNSTTREVLVRVLHASNLGVTGNRWKAQFDQVGLHFN